MSPVKRNELDTAWSPCLPQAGRIFWVPFDGTGVPEEKDSRYSEDLDPDG